MIKRMGKMFNEGANRGVSGIRADTIVSSGVLKCTHASFHGLSRVAFVVAILALMSSILREQNKMDQVAAVCRDWVIDGIAPWGVACNTIATMLGPPAVICYNTHLKYR